MAAEPVDPYELRAAMHRVLAGRLRLVAAEQDLAATAVLATRSMRRFAEAMNSSVRQEVAAHPDLAELNVQMDGFYDDGAEGQEGGEDDR